MDEQPWNNSTAFKTQGLRIFQHMKLQILCLGLKLSKKNLEVQKDSNPESQFQSKGANPKFTEGISRQSRLFPNFSPKEKVPHREPFARKGWIIESTFGGGMNSLLSQGHFQTYSLFFLPFSNLYLPTSQSLEQNHIPALFSHSYPLKI